VVHALVDTYSPSSTRPPRVDQAEEAKRKKYAELFASQPFAFIPVGLDTLGSLGASAKTFLWDLEGKLFGHHHADNSGEDSTGDTPYLSIVHQAIHRPCQDGGMPAGSDI